MQCILANLVLVRVGVGVHRSNWYGHIGASSDSSVTWLGVGRWDAVTNANVFVALGVEVSYVDVSETMFFSRYERTSSRMADRDRRLFVVTFHVAVSNPEARKELS